jgi:VanZ family protein
LHLTYRLSELRRPAAPPVPSTATAAQYRWLALGALALTVYGCLIPLRYRPMPPGEALAAFRGMAYLDPSLLGARGDWVVSIFQFAAPSYLVMGALCADRHRAVGVATAALVVPGIVALGIGLEFLQLYFPPRTVSLNDIALESLGGALGVVLWLLAGQRLTVWFRRFWGARGIAGLAAQALPAYLILLVVVHLMPFDLMVSAGEIAQKYREGRIALLPFRGAISGGLGAATKPLTNLALFFPLGVLVALVPRWAHRVGRRRWAILPLGLGITTLIELLQFFVYSRYCDTTDIVTGTAALVVGWRLARDPHLVRRLGGTAPAYRRLVGRPGPAARRATWGLLACGWFAALALVNWQPFDFTTDPARFATADALLTDEDTPVYGWRRMAWAPLVDCYWGSKYSVVDQLARKAVSFAPLGVLMALGPCRRDRRGAGLLVCLAALPLGGAIEVGQYFIPERHPSTSDLLVHCCGAWLGFAATRHVGAALRAGADPIGRTHEFGR